MNKRLHHGIQNLVFRIASWILPVVLTWTMAIPALAANTAEAPSGTLTIRPKYGDQILTASEYDGTFKIYHIADYDPHGTFTKDTALNDLDVTIDNATLSNEESYKELTQAVARYVKENSKNIVPLHTGIRVDETLTLYYGLYLVMPDRTATGYEAPGSFLVMIPAYGENTTDEDVIAYPKVSKVTTPPETPNEPHDHHDPDTPGSPATPNINEIGSIEEAGTESDSGLASIEEAGAFTGDSSQMLLYGAVAAAAAVALVVWVLHRRKSH